MKKLLSQLPESKFPNFHFGKKISIYSDFYENAGVASGHYFHQDLYMASKIYQVRPQEHYDIGSRVDGFIAHLAVFMKVTIFDIRYLETSANNIEFQQLDIMDSLQVSNLPKVSSLSCLHTVEHFGLGRYKDPVDIDGWINGLRNMTSILLPGGNFYFSTPVSSRQRIEFNAHRVFNPVYLTQILLRDYEVVEMSIVRDSGEIEEGVDFLSQEFESNFDDDYACGMWVLRKK
jgi:hypothetical protein